MKHIYIILLFTFLTLTNGYGQLLEICDNGIDDDMNGLIDLNDDACECGNELPTSLIPNPSFEERTCCPTSNARLDCAIDWVQASGPTTDYIHTCGNYLGNASIPAFAPLPLADGEGAVGFRDGQANVGSGYKEYVGACLIEPMRAGREYKLQFYVGFRDGVTGSMSLDIAIFGGTTCSELPFGNGSTSVGCPANTSTYDQIDIQFVSGSNEWVIVEFEFTPTKDYEVMVIGPSCAPNPNTQFSPYFYLDGLTLAQTSLFGTPLDNVEGEICNDNLVLSITGAPEQTYQWYKNGIAIIGETTNSLMLTGLPENEGSYLVVTNTDGGCLSTRAYNVRIPPYFADFETTICEGDEFSIEDSTWTEQGIYETTIKAIDGCDSIITLDLTVSPTTYAEIEDSYCEGDTFSILDILANVPGDYQSTTTNNMGCDSIITLILEEIPATEGIDIPSVIDIQLGDIIDIEPNNYDPLLIHFNWTDSEDNLLSIFPILEAIQPLTSETLTITAEDKYGCDIQEQVMVRIDRSSINIYTPNIFSPDGNGVNDYFNFFASDALSSVEQFIVYDRWGNIVYNQKDIIDFDNMQGWDGYSNGKPAEQGVYVWMVKATFIDNTKITYSGDLTLVRF